MKAKNAALAFVLSESPILGRNLNECSYQYLYSRCRSNVRNRALVKVLNDHSPDGGNYRYMNLRRGRSSDEIKRYVPINSFLRDREVN